MDINEWVAPESNNTQNGFEFKKRVQVTTVLEVAASFLFITNALPATASLEGGGPWRSGAKGSAMALSTAFSRWGHAVMRCSGLPHHMHLLVPTRHSGVV